VFRSLLQLSSANPVYEKFYRQVDSANTGRVLASDADVFLKKSGLTDLILGKIWDLADTDGKGILNKQEFFVALRLVACAQNGLDVSLSSLNLPVPPPRFTDTGSPSLLSGTASSDVPWAVKLEDKTKYDAIFDSLNPVNGLLSGDKVKPVLLNSKLPVDILGRVWELSDIDRDGMLDRDEFAVYCGFCSCCFFSPSISTPPQWVVSPADKIKYDEIFVKTDKDMDGFVSGVEARELFLKTGLPSALLAHIWALCDTKDCGKLSKEQFALAFYLINQKLTKGIDPPQALTPEMIPPSDRGVSLQKVRMDFSFLAFFLAKKKKNTTTLRIPKITNVCENTKHWMTVSVDNATSSVSSHLSLIMEKNYDFFAFVTKVVIAMLKAEITSQESKISAYEDELTKAQEELSRLQQETAELEHCIESGKAQLGPLQQHLQDSQQEINSVQTKLLELKELENNQFSWPSQPHNTLVNGTADHSSLSNSSSETANLNENAERESIVEDEQINSVSPMRNSPETTAPIVEEEKETPAATITEKEDPFDAESHPLPDLVSETSLEFFQSDPFVDNDPFKDDPFGKIDPFGGDPFKGSDPFAADCFFKQSSTDPFVTAGSDPFSTADNSDNVTSKLSVLNIAVLKRREIISRIALKMCVLLFSLLKANNEDPFSSSTSSSVNSVIITKNLFEEPPAKNEDVPPALPPKTGTPTRPCPPPPGKRPINQIDSSDSFKPSDPFQPFPTPDIPKEQEADLFCDPFAPTSISKEADPNNFANFSTVS
ncbi:EPS15 factor, partial [Corythaeola cristata]|nr:EPS15 factor [Corythaeola cristata]